MVQVNSSFERGDVFDPDCPTRLVLDRIGDKWTVLVVAALSTGTLRFTELHARVGSIAPKVLTPTLRALERDGVLTRTVYAQVPPRAPISVDRPWSLAGHADSGDSKLGRKPCEPGSGGPRKLRHDHRMMRHGLPEGLTPG